MWITREPLSRNSVRILTNKFARNAGPSELSSPRFACPFGAGCGLGLPLLARSFVTKILSENFLDRGSLGLIKSAKNFVNFNGFVNCPAAKTQKVMRALLSLRFLMLHP
jgi:hypothetical protein